MRKFVLTMALLASVNLAFGDVVVGIGGGYKKMMDSIIESYNQENPNNKIIRRYGNMKFLATQVQENKLDALIGLEPMFQKIGIESKNGFVLGYNKIVLVGTKDVELESFEDLKGLKSILVLNEDKGRFGVDSMKFLKGLGFYKDIESKVVFSDDMHLIVEDLLQNKAQAGILNAKYYFENQNALGDKLEIPIEAYNSLKVMMVQLKKTAGLKSFEEYLKSPKIAEILRKYGISN